MRSQCVPGPFSGPGDKAKVKDDPPAMNPSIFEIISLAEWGMSLAGWPILRRSLWKNRNLL